MSTFTIEVADFISICTTEGCENFGIEFENTAQTSGHSFYCGPCGQKCGSVTQISEPRIETVEL